MPPSQVKLLEGKILAKKIQEDIRAAIDEFAAKGLEKPGLLSIQAGEDPSAAWYIGRQEKLAGKLGIAFEKVTVSEQAALNAALDHAKTQKNKFHGVFVSMPLPAGFNADEVLAHLDPAMDVEGIHPSSLGLIVLRKAKLIPSTAYAVIKLIESTGARIRGKKAVLVGQSAIVGRPVQLLLGERRVTTVVCNTGTPEAEIRKAVSEADIVVACSGRPRMIKGEWIKSGAIVIDVGTTEIDGRLVGDVEFESAGERAEYITPVPGGVGPLTVTMLMQNLIHAYRAQKGI